MADGLLGIPHIAYAKAQVNRNKSLDVSKLDVSFGGFTPMPLNDGMATREQVLSTEARIRERRPCKMPVPQTPVISSTMLVRTGNTSCCRNPRSALSAVRMRKASLQFPIRSRVCRFARWRPMLARA